MIPCPRQARSRKPYILKRTRTTLVDGSEKGEPHAIHTSRDEQNPDQIHPRKIVSKATLGDQHTHVNRTRRSIDNVRLKNRRRREKPHFSERCLEKEGKPDGSCIITPPCAQPPRSYRFIIIFWGLTDSAAPRLAGCPPFAVDLLSPADTGFYNRPVVGSATFLPRDQRSLEYSDEVWYYQAPANVFGVGEKEREREGDINRGALKSGVLKG